MATLGTSSTMLLLIRGDPSRQTLPFYECLSRSGDTDLVVCTVERFEHDESPPDSQLFIGLSFTGDFAGRSVIIKTGVTQERAARLEREYDLYERHRDAQGKVIPDCLGFFAGRPETPFARALVLVDCGETCDTMFKTKSLDRLPVLVRYARRSVFYPAP